jgi:hypothetical protein
MQLQSAYPDCDSQPRDFAPVKVNKSLTLLFNDDDKFESHHLAFHVSNRAQGKESGQRGDYRALCNLLLRRGVASFGIAGPCILGEPLVRHAAERAVGPAEEHRGGAEGRNFNLPTSRDCLPGLWATNHKRAHTTRSLGRAYWSFAKRR